MEKLLNTISRYVVAIVFIFSGFVKLVDPYGTAYKITDYLETVHFLLPFWLALTLSVLLSITEFSLGMNALFKTMYVGTTKLLTLVILLFTVLTLYIAITDPVQDCGCFGDALIISNWQTFGKNIILLFMILILLRNRNYLRRRLPAHNQKLMTLSYIVFALILSITAIRHLPFIDFRPYAVGTYIPEKMKVSEGLPQDIYETTFIYEKDGVQKEFTEENYPWQDSTWSYVDSKSVLITKGAEAPIHDFVIEDAVMGDITEDLLHDDSYSFLLLAPKLDKASLKHQKDIERTVNYCTDHGYRFLVLTASIDQVVVDFLAHFKTPITVCNVDEITLKTIIRAQPGLVILQSGTILAKYHHNDIPDFTKTEEPLSLILSLREKRKNQIIVLLLVLLMGGVIYKLSQHKKYTT